METSVFTDKAKTPTNDDLKAILGRSFANWTALRDFVFEKYTLAVEQWNYPGQKYGWSFRIKDKKRAIIYLLPGNNHFKAAFVFGQKATDAILASDIADEIKTELKNAKVYGEGRGIRIEVSDKNMEDMKRLIEIKLAI